MLCNSLGRGRGVLVGAALVISQWCVPTWAAVGYVFTNVADDRGTFGPVMTMPTINARGTAVFYGSNDQGEGIFAGSGGAVTVIASEGGNPEWGFATDSSQGPKINDLGRAVFVGSRPGEEARVFSGDGGLLTTVAGPPDYSIDYGNPGINNSGAVAFGAVSTLPGVGGGFFVSEGGAIRKVAPAAALYYGDKRLAVNDSGQVAFQGIDGQDRRFLFRGDTAGATVIAPLAGSGITDFGTPDMNDSGVVAFVGGVGPFETGVYVGDGQSSTAVAPGSGAVRGFVYHGVAINNLMGVAFYASEANGVARGIFTGPDPVADKVIRFGDPLFGSTLSIAEITHGALNDSGQIAFKYRLADDTIGIAIATPVPEPLSGAVWALAAGCLAGRGRYRRDR